MHAPPGNMASHHAGYKVFKKHSKRVWAAIAKDLLVEFVGEDNEDAWEKELKERINILKENRIL